MRVSPGLQPLIEDGIVDSVVGQLQSGKEAVVYIVARGEQLLCAKVYKSAEQRNFRRVAEYREGRKGRGSRNSRATNKRSRHGRKIQEAQWKSAEADALYRLVDAGVRVPAPHGVHEGVLLMELVCDDHGDTAPRINEIEMTVEQAREWHAFIIEQIVRMLCAGLIHGDLSEFNVLLGPSGPVIIDLPQAVDAAGNNNAFRMLERDVGNMRTRPSHAWPPSCSRRISPVKCGISTKQVSYNPTPTSRAESFGMSRWPTSRPCWIKSRRRDKKPRRGN